MSRDPGTPMRPRPTAGPIARAVAEAGFTQGMVAKHLCLSVAVTHERLRGGRHRRASYWSDDELDRLAVLCRWSMENLAALVSEDKAFFAGECRWVPTSDARNCWRSKGKEIVRLPDGTWRWAVDKLFGFRPTKPAAMREAERAEAALSIPSSL